MSSELTMLVLLANIASTFFMAGLIWFVQTAHYPLFVQVGREQFAGYHAAHVAASTRLVVAPMVIEASTAAALCWQPPAQNLAAAFWVGMGLVVVLWVSTANLQVPAHNKLSVGFDPDTHRSLVSRNWIRSSTWSIRGVLMLYVLSRTLIGGVDHGS